MQEDVKFAFILLAAMTAAVIASAISHWGLRRLPPAPDGDLTTDELRRHLAGDAEAPPPAAFDSEGKHRWN